MGPLEASRLDLQSFLPFNVLAYSDRMSMRHGLELRAPFVDHHLIGTVAGLPESFMLGARGTKRALRHAMGADLPEHILGGRKVGLNPPLGSWIKASKAQVDDLLSPATVRGRGIISSEAVQRLRNAHDSGARDLSMQIWALMALEMWFRMRVDH
jgi:asparagine synthase (glutamine-hydrolysing)